MKYKAIAKKIQYSPYKLRPIVDVIRGKSAQIALNWLATYKESGKRVLPIRKVIESAVANAKNLDNHQVSDLFIQEIRVDEGPTHKYFKPGAMGRAQVQRRRTCQIQVVIEDLKSAS